VPISDSVNGQISQIAQYTIPYRFKKIYTAPSL